MQCSSGTLFSWVNRLKIFKSHVKFISSANQEIILQEEKLLEGLETNIEGSDDYAKKPRVVYSKTHFEAISSYFDSKLCLQDVKAKVPPHFMLRTYKCPHSLYFIDADVGSKHFRLVFKVYRT